MKVCYKRFVVWTKERPTHFLMVGGDVSKSIEDAFLLETAEDAKSEIQKCDEPEAFKVYDMTISVNRI